MKKILLITENFPPIEGGSGRWFWELYSRLPRENIIIATNSCSGGDEFDKSHSLNVIRIPLSSPEWGFASKRGISFYWHSLNRLRKIVKEHNIEEVHCGRVIHEGVVAWLLKKVTGIPYKCFIHGEDIDTAATSREHFWMVKKVCENSQKLICNSENSARLAVELGYTKPKHCEVMHPGVDLELFHPRPENTEFKNKMGWTGKTVLLTVGRLQRRKGQDYMIKALPMLLEKIPNLLYVVVGSGDCFDDLVKEVNDLNLHGSVQILTTLNDEDLICSYQNCDLFVLPNRTIGSDIEGFGMVLVEAQACGKGVVAGNSGGTRETMAIGKTGCIIDCNSPQEIYKGILPILQNSEFKLWELNSRIFVEKNLGWDAHVKKFISLL